MAKSKGKSAKSPPTFRDRLSVFVRILTHPKRLSLLAIALIGSGWVMVTGDTHVPLGIALIGAGLFFGAA
jgi:hypothetical protein